MAFGLRTANAAATSAVAANITRDQAFFFIGGSGDGGKVENNTSLFLLLPLAVKRERLIAGYCYYFCGCFFSAPLLLQLLGQYTLSKEEGGHYFVRRPEYLI